jgi:hypothetical protein
VRVSAPTRRGSRRIETRRLCRVPRRANTRAFRALPSDALELHIVELPKLERAEAEGHDVPLERWARYLRCDDPSELDSLAEEDPIMAEAKDALETLSLDPAARRLAEQRAEAEFFLRMDLREERAEGRVEGRIENAREMLGSLLRARGVTLTPEQQALIVECGDLDLLRRWFERAVTAADASAVFADR